MRDRNGWRGLVRLAGACVGLLTLLGLLCPEVGAREPSKSEIEAYERSFSGYCESLEDFLDARPYNTFGFFQNPGNEERLFRWGTEQGLKGLEREIPLSRRRQALDQVYRLIIKQSLPDAAVAADAPDAGVKVVVGEPRVVMWAPEGKTADKTGNKARLGHLFWSIPRYGRWGQHMFPSIYKLRSGQLLVRVSVGGDGYPRDYLYYLSEDGGRNWQHFASYDENSKEPVEMPASAIALRLPDGEELRCLEPWLGKRIERGDRNLKTYAGYYRLGDLPREMQSVPLLTRKPGEEKWTEEQAYWDPDVLVKDHDQLPMPLTMHWLSENHVMRDGSLLSTVFKGLPVLSEIGPDGTREARAHPIVRSYDRGRTWKVEGEIPPSTWWPWWSPPQGGSTVRAHLLEFPNGNWVAAFRHHGLYYSGGGPLIIRKSSDQGKTWSAPKAIRMPGVNALGVVLENGIAVFSYNRPGVFLTFCSDGKGDLWGNDVTLVKAWKHERDENSCCNGCFLVTGPDRFMYVYTKWDVPDPWGQPRQAVIAQEFVVSKK